MSKRWVTEIMCQSCQFNQVDIDWLRFQIWISMVQSDSDRFCYLSYLKRMSKSIAKKVRFVARKNLSFTLQSSK